MAQKIEIDIPYSPTILQCKQIISIVLDKYNKYKFIFCDLNAIVYPCEDDITSCSICQCGHKVFFENEYDIFDDRYDCENIKSKKEDLK